VFAGDRHQCGRAAAHLHQIHLVSSEAVIGMARLLQAA
jgi:hypothetical protein